VIALTDPVYPVYSSTATSWPAAPAPPARDGRYTGIVYMPTTGERLHAGAAQAARRRHLPVLAEQPDRNAAATGAQLQCWSTTRARCGRRDPVRRGLRGVHRRSVAAALDLEIEGAREVAIEFRSFSKTAGFTGTRCAYTVWCPKRSRRDWRGRAHPAQRSVEPAPHHQVQRRLYPVQRAAAATFSPDGHRQTREIIAFYMEKCPTDSRGADSGGVQGVWGRERALHLAPDAGWLLVGSSSIACWDRRTSSARQAPDSDRRVRGTFG
jgi:LL-diaminopimelate aminotransferase